MRVYARGTRRLLGARLVDSGSGYNAQNDMPVHLSVPANTRIDIEVTYPGNAQRATTWVRDVDPRTNRRVTIRTGSRQSLVVSR